MYLIHLLHVRGLICLQKAFKTDSYICNAFLSQKNYNNKFLGQNGIHNTYYLLLIIIIEFVYSIFYPPTPIFKNYRTDFNRQNASFQQGL